MTYTVTIEQTGKQAQSIIDMLKALSVDYDFLKIHENAEDRSMAVKDELDSRYEYVIKNPTVGKSWNEVKENLRSK